MIEVSKESTWFVGLTKAYQYGKFRKGRWRVKMIYRV
jgi:hypothetical protein